MKMNRTVAPLVLLVSGVVLGLLSARYMMENASVAIPIANSKWTEIRVGGEDLQSSYLAGHFLRRGQVPPPKATRFYVRNVDDDGNSLRGDCVVTVEGQMPTARWWFVSAASSGGRKTLDAAQVIREASGDFAISLSVSPVAGNWLVPADGGNYDLQLVLLGVEDGAQPVLPSVKRLWC
jgi:hypothetical protein